MRVCEYANGTSLKESSAGYVSGKALCPDGKVRALAYVAKGADAADKTTIRAAVNVGASRIRVSGRVYVDASNRLSFLPDGINANMFD